MHAIRVTDQSYPHRFGTVTVTVVGADGLPLSDADVVIEQTRHAFVFGNIGFDFIPLANGETDDAELISRADKWCELYNTATLPFYWGGFEPVEGQPDTDRLATTGRWLQQRGVDLKGHPLAWHTVAPPWLLEYSNDEVEAKLRRRIAREVSGFAGLIDTWDAINEVVIMPVFTAETNAITRLARQRGRLHMIRLAFEEARSANPNVKLLLNDFDLSSAYECLLEGVLEAGIEIDILGLQTHMHQGYWGEDTMLAMVDRFARYGLPLHLTESSLVSGHLMPPDIVDLNDYQIPSWPSTDEGLARQADEMVRHYRSLLSHPAVQGITYWGISDADAWLGAPIGLLFADGSPKPSYTALRELIKDQWWIAPTTARTDSDGRIEVTGFLGDYRLSVAGQERAFTIASPGLQAITL